jgi:hypothetical protein
MDWQAWRKALELYVNTPEPIYASIFVAITIFGFTWWLRSNTCRNKRCSRCIAEHNNRNLVLG